nr:MAG TPA: hypothetical protein [Caudoviricetes sp.]
MTNPFHGCTEVRRNLHYRHALSSVQLFCYKKCLTRQDTYIKWWVTFANLCEKHLINTKKHFVK